VQLLCRTVKLGWFDHDCHRSIVDDCKTLMDKNSPAHYLLGLRILNTLVQVRVMHGNARQYEAPNLLSCTTTCCSTCCLQEMNSPTAGRTLTQHRKVAVNFRDSTLLRIFQASLAALRDMAAKGADMKLKEQGLALCSLCLSFDFVGTCLDDASEELCTIQVLAQAQLASACPMYGCYSSMTTAAMMTVSAHGQQLVWVSGSQLLAALHRGAQHNSAAAGLLLNHGPSTQQHSLGVPGQYWSGGSFW
jgi:hypothetical protein